MINQIIPEVVFWNTIVWVYNAVLAIRVNTWLSIYRGRIPDNAIRKTVLQREREQKFCSDNEITKAHPYTRASHGTYLMGSLERYRESILYMITPQSYITFYVQQKLSTKNVSSSVGILSSTKVFSNVIIVTHLEKSPVIMQISNNFKYAIFWDKSICNWLLQYPITPHYHLRKKITVEEECQPLSNMLFTVIKS